MRMKSLCLLFLVSLLLPQLALAQEQRSASARDANVLQKVFLRHARTAAEAEYEAIWARERGEARARYRALSSEMKADVWTIHLERFLIEHPDLTPAQRAVMSDALDLIATGLIEANNAIDHSSALWETTVHEPMNTLQERAVAAFGVDVERDIFTRIGIRQPVKSKGHIEPLTYNLQCDCTTGVDQGEQCETCLPRIESGSWCAFTVDGCGFLANLPCNGRCMY